MWFNDHHLKKTFGEDNDYFMEGKLKLIFFTAPLPQDLLILQPLPLSDVSDKRIVSHPSKAITIPLLHILH